MSRAEASPLARTTQSPWLLLLVGWAAAAVPVAAGIGFQGYEVVALEDPPHPHLYAPLPADISDSGMVVGFAATVYDSPYQGWQVLWQHDPQAGYTVFQPFPAHLTARAVNNQGQIAASASAGTLGLERAVRYTPGVGYEYLGSLGGKERDSEHGSMGINNQGQVVGYSERPDGSIHAFCYTDGLGMLDLGTLGGRHSQAYDINDGGWVTGRSRVEDGSDHVFLYRDGTGMVDLGPGVGVSINTAGIIAGVTPSYSGPVLFHDGQVAPLLPLPGTHTYLVGSLNDANVVVGSFLTDDLRELAFIATEDRGVVDLNTLIDPASGWLLQAASAINNHGQIVGFGFYEGRQTAFRLDPIPEPASWMLLALGGAIVLLLQRRCRP